MTSQADDHGMRLDEEDVSKLQRMVIETQKLSQASASAARTGDVCINLMEARKAAPGG